MSDEKRKNKKHNAVLPYIRIPVLFVLISLIIVLPLCFVMLNFSVKAVHKAQNVLVPVISDYSLTDDGFKVSDIKSGNVTFVKPEPFSKLGELSCADAGLSVSVYYGNNRVAYRGGAGLTSKNALPGQGSAIEVTSNSSGKFKALYNVKTGDVITFATEWGKYKYKVYDITVGTFPEPKGETLYLTTAESKTAFAALNGRAYVVSAARVSGPEAKEVQDEQ